MSLRAFFVVIARTHFYACSKLPGGHVPAFKLKKTTFLYNSQTMAQVTTALGNGTNLAVLGKAKHWCITVNNYGDADICQFTNIEESATYYVFGKEVGDSGTRHLQCYVVFKSPKSLAALKKIWPTGYFEHKYQKSTNIQAATYCKKDGNFVEFGIIPEEGRNLGGEKTKENWIQIRLLAQQGKLDEIPPKVFVGCFSNLVKIRDAFQPPVSNLTKPCGLWIWGKAGAGKSFTARSRYPQAYIKMMNKWWDNYYGEEVVILEDFDLSYSTSMHYFLKIWADAYAFRGEMKGTSRMMRPKKFVITSQYKPDQIWNGLDLDAITRRFQLHEVVVSSLKTLLTKRPAELEKMNEVIKKPKLTKAEPILIPVVEGIFKEENEYANVKAAYSAQNLHALATVCISISSTESVSEHSDSEIEEWSNSDEEFTSSSSTSTW